MNYLSDDMSTPDSGSKLSVKIHRKQPTAVNSFEISNLHGAITGGNLQMFILDQDATELCYPTRFKSRASANRYLKTISRYAQTIQDICSEDLGGAQ